MREFERIIERTGETREEMTLNILLYPIPGTTTSGAAQTAFELAARSRLLIAR